MRVIITALAIVVCFPSVAVSRRVHNIDVDTVVRGKTTFLRDTAVADKGSLRLYDSNSSNYVSLESPSTVTSNVEYVLPGTDGTSGYCLQTDGAGTLSWASCTSSSGGSGVTGSGTANYVTYWGSSSSITGSASLQWDPASTLLSVAGGASITGTLTIGGYIGVGTSSPQVQAHIHNGITGSVDSSVLVTTAATGSTTSDGLRMWYDGAGGTGSTVEDNEGDLNLKAVTDINMIPDTAGKVAVGPSAGSAYIYIKPTGLITGSSSNAYEYSITGGDPTTADPGATIRLGGSTRGDSDKDSIIFRQGATEIGRFSQGGYLNVGTTDNAPKFPIIAGTSSSSFSPQIGLWNHGNTVGTASGLMFSADNSGNYKGGIAFTSQETGYGRGVMDVLINYTASATDATLADSVATFAYNGVTVSQPLTVTTDLTVDTNTLYVDSTNGRVGVGTITPASTLDVTGDVSVSGDLTVDTTTLYVDSTGNQVGVGTASPGKTLDVSGTGRLSSTLTLSSILSCTGANGLQTNASGDVSCGAVAGSISGSGAANQMTYWTGANTVAGDSGITYNAASDALTVVGDLTVDTTTLHVDSTGNQVGIGTASPSTALHINSGGLGFSVPGNSLLTVQNNVSAMIMNFLSSTSGKVEFFLGDSGNPGQGRIIYDNATDGLNLYTNNSSAMTIDSAQNVNMVSDLTVDTNTLYVDSTNGVVSVGSATPATADALYVNSASSGYTGIMLNSPATGASSGGKITLQSNGVAGRRTEIYMNSGNGTQTYGSALDTVIMNTYTGSAIGDIHLGTQNTINVTVESGGQVGIGTTTPSSLLDVDAGTGRGIIEIDGSTGGCLKIRDTDDAGWTYCTTLNGTMTCSVSAC